MMAPMDEHTTCSALVVKQQPDCYQKVKVFLKGQMFKSKQFRVYCVTWTAEEIFLSNFVQMIPIITGFARTRLLPQGYCSS